MDRLYPQGRYWGHVVSQFLGETKAKRTPQVSLAFEVESSIDAKTGRRTDLLDPPKRYVNLYLTEAAMPIAVEALTTLGFNRGTVRALERTRVDYQDLTGAECELYCKHETYQGVERERWSINTPRDEPRQPTADRDEAIDAIDKYFAASLAERGVPLAKPKGEWGKAAADINAARGEPAVRRAEPDDDPIPF